MSPDPRELCFHAFGDEKLSFAGLEMKNQPVRPEKRLVSGLGEKKSVARPARALFSRIWGRKIVVRGSGNEKPARETRKEISFGSGREKECRQTRRKPKCSHVSQKNRRLYAKTGLQREKVLCRPVLILCTTSANND